MFAEVINDYRRHVDSYEAGCPDAVNKRIVGELRQCVARMQAFDNAGANLSRKADDLRQKMQQARSQRKSRLSRMARLVGISEERLKKQNQDGRPLKADELQRNMRDEKSGGRRGEDRRPEVVRRPDVDGKCLVRKERKMTKAEEQAAEAAVKEFKDAVEANGIVERELKKLSNVLSVAEEVRRNLSDISARRQQLSGIGIITEMEFSHIQYVSDEAARMVGRIERIADSAANARSMANDDVSSADSERRTLIMRMRELEEFDKTQRGHSSKVKNMLFVVKEAIKRLEPFQKRKDSVFKRHQALWNDIGAAQNKWHDIQSRRNGELRRAKTIRTNRSDLLSELDSLARKTSADLSTLTSRAPSSFLRSEQDPSGIRMNVLSVADAEAENLIGNAIAACRSVLVRATEICRGRQKPLDELTEKDVNLTVAFPLHIVMGETTHVLNGTGLSVPIAKRFPFEKPLVFAHVEDIAPLLIRFLYALPPGKVRICALDHHAAGEHVIALNALCGLDGVLRVVTENDAVTQTLSEFESQMGALSRDSFDYQANNWLAYNAAHPADPIPLRILVVYSLASASSRQVELLEKLLNNGLKFGMLCLISEDALSDLDERIRARITLTEMERVRRLNLTSGTEAKVSAALLGRLTETYVNILGEIFSKPKRQIDFLSLFEGLEFWGESSARGLAATVGWDAKGNNVDFEFGVGRGATNYHALIGGTTGSGKSVFLHALIQSLAGRYSPEELELYLLDYKKGDEFKKYADAKGDAWLPHVRMISRHKDPRFALELFSFLDEEFKHRSDLFGSESGDFVTYRERGGKMPRIVVIIDEFQVLFEDYCGLNLSDEIAARLATVFKQGRSYGIHIVLATQSLASMHFSGMAGILGQVGLRVALKGQAADGILDGGNRAAETIVAKRQCVLNPDFGRKDNDSHVYNIVTDVPFSDPAQVEGCKKFRSVIESVARKTGVRSSCRVFNGAALPMPPAVSALAGILAPGEKEWKTQFSLILGSRTDFRSTPFVVAFLAEPREHLLIAGEDGKISTDFEVRIDGSDIWTGLLRGICVSLSEAGSCDVLYYNPGERDVPRGIPDSFIALAGLATEEDLIKAIHELESSSCKSKVMLVENFQDATLLHPADAPRPSYSARPTEPPPETAHSIFASLFNGSGAPKIHTILMTKNFGYMNKEVLARSGAEANILKSCSKRVAYNLSDDDLSVMIPHQKVHDRRGPRRIWYENRMGNVIDFMPYAWSDK